MNNEETRGQDLDLTRPTDAADRGPLRVTRRRVLAAGTTCAISAVGVGLVATKAPADATTLDAEPLALELQPSIGYCPFEELDRANGTPVRLLAADRIASGDRERLAASARVTIHTLFEPNRRPTPSFVLTANYVVGERQEAQMIPVPVWSHDRSPVVSLGRAVSFSMPTAAAKGLHLTLSRPEADAGARTRASRRTVVQDVVRESAPGASTPISFRFTLTDEAGTPKLRRGHYFIPLLRSHTSRPPAWNACRLHADLEDPTNLGRLSRRTAAGFAPVDFAYLHLSIDA